MSGRRRTTGLFSLSLLFGYALLAGAPSALGQGQAPRLVVFESFMRPT